MPRSFISTASVLAYALSALPAQGNITFGTAKVTHTYTYGSGYLSFANPLQPEPAGTHVKFDGSVTESFSTRYGYAGFTADLGAGGEAATFASYSWGAGSGGMTEFYAGGSTSATVRFSIEGGYVAVSPRGGSLWTRGGIAITDIATDKLRYYMVHPTSGEVTTGGTLTGEIGPGDYELTVNISPVVLMSHIRPSSYQAGLAFVVPEPATATALLALAPLVMRRRRA